MTPGVIASTRKEQSLPEGTAAPKVIRSTTPVKRRLPGACAAVVGPPAVVLMTGCTTKFVVPLQAGSKMPAAPSQVESDTKARDLTPRARPSGTAAVRRGMATSASRSNSPVRIVAPPAVYQVAKARSPSPSCGDKASLACVFLPATPHSDVRTLRRETPVMPSRSPLEASSYQQASSRAQVEVAAVVGAVGPGRCPPHQMSPRSASQPPRVEAASPTLPPPSAGKSSVLADSVQRVGQLLQDRDVLKSIVIDCFRTSVVPGGESLDLHRVAQFRDRFLEVAHINKVVLNQIAEESVRFDFSGSGRLEMNEVYKLVKFHLREWHKRHCGDASGTVNVPTKSLAKAGYRVLRELGKGAQASAMLATNAEGQQVCIKTYKKVQMTALGVEELKDEFEALQLLSCDRVARAFEIFQDVSCYYMVNEACLGGDFTTLQQRARAQGVTMSEDWWSDIFRQCFEALAFMHQQAVMHCDIKEANLMMRTTNFRRPEVVVIDFGVSKAMAPACYSCPGLCGTPGYMPPETWESGRWFPKGDVFALGVCIFQLMANKLPPTGPRYLNTPGGIFIEGCGSHQDIALATRTRTPPFFLLAPLPQLKQLAQRLLQKQMSSRPTAAQALADPWFKTSPLRCSSEALTNSAKGPLPESTVHPRNRFATVGITSDYLEQHDHECQAAAAESDDSEEAAGDISQPTNVQSAVPSQTPVMPAAISRRDVKPRSVVLGPDAKQHLPIQPAARSCSTASLSISANANDAHETANPAAATADAPNPAATAAAPSALSSTRLRAGSRSATSLSREAVCQQAAPPRRERVHFHFPGPDQTAGTSESPERSTPWRTSFGRKDELPAPTSPEVVSTRALSPPSKAVRVRERSPSGEVRWRELSPSGEAVSQTGSIVWAPVPRWTALTPVSASTSPGTTGAAAAPATPRIGVGASTRELRTRSPPPPVVCTTAPSGGSVVAATAQPVTSLSFIPAASTQAGSVSFGTITTRAAISISAVSFAKAAAAPQYAKSQQQQPPVHVSVMSPPPQVRTDAVLVAATTNLSASRQLVSSVSPVICSHEFRKTVGCVG